MGNSAKRRRKLILEHRKLLIKVANDGNGETRSKMDEIEKRLGMTYEELGEIAKEEYLKGY